MKKFEYETASRKELVEEIIIELSGVSSWVVDCRKNVKKSELDEETLKVLISHLSKASVYMVVLSKDNEERKQCGLEPWK